MRLFCLFEGFGTERQRVCRRPVPTLTVQMLPLSATYYIHMLICARSRQVYKHRRGRPPSAFGPLGIWTRGGGPCRE